jgi:glucose-6-phosphate-specific signal transduction histidine kinase
MNKRQIVAQSLVGFGSLIMLVGAGLHLYAGYPLASTALAASNLTLLMANAMRAVFLMIGLTWITIAVVTLIAAFTQTRIRKPLVLFCSLSLLAAIPIWVRLMGWFIGNEMFVLSGVLVAFGGFLLPPSPKP